uniref:Ubiquitin-conjugating enzyme E2 2 n=1 Tax=Ganoderma boninense TaxID=34458 RepID=A0A5K1K6D8_9APHY|nr:Ubiquitin-conjugating enzyme E2 2 [Ganoderma boninense]
MPARWTWQANAPPVPSHWTQTNVPLVLPQANASPMPPHWARANAGYPTGGGLMGPIAPLALPFAGGLDLGDPFNTSFNSFNLRSVPSSLPPRFNDAGLGAPMPPLRAESHVFSARSQTTFAPAPAPAPAPVPTASEPYALQVPLKVSNFVHWSVRHGPSAL